MKVSLFVTLLLVASRVFANTEGQHEAGVPSIVFWQAFNVVILFSALIYILKDKARATFAKRQKDYLEAAEKSKKAQQEAEKQYLDIKHKLDLLESTTEESVARARAEAAELKKVLISDAQAAAKKIKIEAQESARLESQRAFILLKNKTIQDSLGLARQVLTRDIGNQDHQKLQSDFARNLPGASL